jgi:hypothetical protein
MAKSNTTEISINNFSGGLSDSPRENNATKAQVLKHFDIFTDPYRLIPYRSLETDTNDGSTSTGMKQYYIKDFVYASQSTKLYGLGQNASGYTKIAYKADATTGNWTLPSSSEGTTAVINGCFFEYKDYLWGFATANKIFKWGTLSGTPSLTESVTTVGATISSVANGIIAADGNAYMAYNNVIVRIAPGLTITDSAKTVPDTYKITSLANYGSYMAIACSPISSYNGKSKVFIWNLSSDLFVETIDWGEGDLRVLENIDGLLIGITDRYLNNATGAGKGSMVIQAYGGGAVQVLKEIYTKALTGKTIPLSKTVKNNRLFWAAKIMTNSAGTEYVEGIWSFGRKNSAYPYALSVDIIDENINTSGIQGFGNASNFFFIAHSADGSIDKTDDTSAYSFSSIYESQIYDFGEPDKNKQIELIKVSFSPITSGQSLTVKMKVNQASSWTTVGTYNTVGANSYTFAWLSTGAAFPSGKECELRLESTGGLEITGYKIRATILNDL